MKHIEDGFTFQDKQKNPERKIRGVSGMEYPGRIHTAGMTEYGNTA